MNQDVLDMCERRFGPVAARMEEETIAVSTATIHLDGEDQEMPVIVVKGAKEATLRQPVVRCQVLGIETSECPVIAVGIEFPRQVEAFAGWYWSWIPMHTAGQRELATFIAKAPTWLVVVFSGSSVSRAVIVGVNDIARARYRQLELVIQSYPTDPEPDTGRAIDAAQAATAAVMGDGFELETVKDIRQEDID